MRCGYDSRRPAQGHFDVDNKAVTENERTPRLVTVFGMGLHSMGLSVREVVAVLELFGINCSLVESGTDAYTRRGPTRPANGGAVTGRRQRKTQRR